MKDSEEHKFEQAIEIGGSYVLIRFSGFIV